MKDSWDASSTAIKRVLHLGISVFMLVLAMPCHAACAGITTPICYPALFNPARSTMQLFMWQHDIVGVTHYIMECVDALGALSDDASISSSSALATK